MAVHSAHTLFEVIPNTITHGLTDPKKVYALRWVAGRYTGVPEFAPPLQHFGLTPIFEHEQDERRLEPPSQRSYFRYLP
jgi:hypothetical protein